MQDEELKHYGVIGMKWGVRRARKRAAKESVAGRSRFSTGKNYDAVYNKFKKEFSPVSKKYDKAYKKLIDDGNKYNAEVITTGKSDQKKNY